MMKPRQPKINFKVIKRRLLRIEVWYHISKDGKVFTYDQEKLYMSVRWRQKINITALEIHLSERLRSLKLKRYADFKVIQIESISPHNAGPVFEVQGDV